MLLSVIRIQQGDISSRPRNSSLQWLHAAHWLHAESTVLLAKWESGLSASFTDLSRISYLLTSSESSIVHASTLSSRGIDG